MVVSVWLKLNLGERCLLQIFFWLGENDVKWYDYMIYL